MAVVLAKERTCTAAGMSDGLTMGQRIRMVRNLRKMSMDALARETGMSKNQVVQRLEFGWPACVRRVWTHELLHLRCGWDDERVRWVQAVKYGELIAA